MASVPPVVIAAGAKHTGTIIFLHGLGDTGHGWASAIGAIRPRDVKVICPTADSIPVTLNGGCRMPSWFDLLTLDANGPEDSDGIEKARSVVHSMIDQELKSGIEPHRIVLGGFSQGGALALYSSLTYPKKLAGVVALSGWLPMHKSFPGALKSSNEIPVLQCHGDCDAIVPYKWGTLTSSVLKGFLKNVEFKSYQGLSHSSSDEELEDVKKFFEKCLPFM